MRRIFRPALVLFLLAPLVGELLSGSMPPVEWLNPIGVALNLILYGGGAILVRELTFRWGKGWPTLLVLGAAYGILEEGLLCKSFFDPNWMDIGPLGTYGRWAGVSWVWTAGLTVYHATVSTVIPITLVGLVFPERRGESWAGKRLLVVLAVLLAADVVVGYLFFGADEASGRPAYRPPVAAYLLCGLVMAALVALALRLPSPAPRTLPPGTRAARPVWFVLTGLLGGVWFFATMYVLPNAVVQGRRLHPAADVAIIVAGVAVLVWLMWRLSRRGSGWTDGRRLAACAGPLAFLAALAPLASLDVNRKDNPAGMWLVGLAALAFLILLAWRVHRRRPEPEEPPPAAAAVAVGPGPGAVNEEAQDP